MEMKSAKQKNQLNEQGKPVEEFINDPQIVKGQDHEDPARKVRYQEEPGDGEVNIPVSFPI